LPVYLVPARVSCLVACLARFCKCFVIGSLFCMFLPGIRIFLPVLLVSARVSYLKG
jgi:hypothetical protein